MKSILIALTFLFVQNLYAFDSCDGRDPKLFFANGMFNSKDAALKSADALARIVPPESASALPVQLAYNINENALSQLLEVARQKSSELASHFWKYLGNMSLAPENFRAIAVEILFSIDSFEYEQDEDLRRHIELYNKTLQGARSVVVVAHSQGNLYALASLNRSKFKSHSEHRMDLISIATPMYRGFKEETYTTLEQDQIMNAARLATGGSVLPANIRNSRATLSGHNFIEDYLMGDRSGKKIASELADLLKKKPLSYEGEGEIEDPMYLHSSLIPFWLYLHKIIATPEQKLSRSQCLAVMAFSNVYRWWGAECSRRSVDGVDQHIEACRETWLNNGAKYINAMCGVFMDDPSDSSLIYADLFFQSLLETHHPECIFIRLRGKNDVITDSDIDGAKELLRNPPSPP